VTKKERWLLVCGACVALGALALDAAAQNAPEPLWAYAYSTPPKPGDKATPQAAPTRNLRHWAPRRIKSGWDQVAFLRLYTSFKSHIQKHPDRRSRRFR
jgi:hypothetical protein